MNQHSQPPEGASTFVERRAEKAIPMHVLSHVGEVMERFREEEKERHARMDENADRRFKAIEDKIQHLTDSITAFMGRAEALFDGFPDQDPHGHRKAHEMWLEESREKKEFYVSMKKELAKYGLLAFAGWLFFQAIQYIRTGN